MYFFGGMNLIWLMFRCYRFALLLIYRKLEACVYFAHESQREEYVLEYADSIKRVYAFRCCMEELMDYFKHIKCF